MAKPFDLDPASWQTLRRLLDEALSVPAPARAAWLADLPAEHGALKPHLQSLLANATQAESLEQGPQLPVADEPRETIGPYRLLRPLGEGGMASVWLAERTDVLQRRQVALKLPHGAWRRAGLAERLAREREILATLEHPHIARLYDAGLGAAQQPYLALEYVEGERIDTWCDARGAGLGERLAVFLQVCDAVAHAHARLVVHRDLKPANVLVDAAGQVKLLDFGIAKLLEDGSTTETELTRDHGRALTLNYAAPEQVLGQPLGTAADQYALGVLLYELLAGTRPYTLERSGVASLEAALRQLDIRPPSERAASPERRRALRGDLDTIVLKALKPRPDQRYASVAALADDLRRHLAHEPVLARPDSRAYRWGRFVRRHRVAVLGGTLAAATLAGGAGLALWQAAEARAARDLALAEAAAARRAERAAEAQTDLADFLISELLSRQSIAAATQTLERSAELARAQHQRDPALRGEMLVDVAMRLREVGAMARATELLQEAEPLVRAHGRPEGQARLLCVLAGQAARAGQPAEARALLADARTALARVQGAGGLARPGCLLEESLFARQAGDTTRAVQLAEAAVAARRQGGPAEGVFDATMLMALAQAYAADGRLRDAADTGLRAAQLLERIGQHSAPSLRSVYTIRAAALRDGGLPLAALEAHRGDGRLEPEAEQATAVSRSQYAETLSALGRHDDALAVLARIEPTMRSHGDAGNLRTLLLRRVQALVDGGRPEAAEAPLAEAEAAGPPTARVALARLHWALAAGRLDLAEAARNAAQALLHAARQVDPRQQRQLARGTARLALARGDGAAALQAAGQALGLSQRQAIDPAASLWVAEDLLLRAQARAASGDSAGARADAASALAQARAAAGPAHPLAQRAAALAARAGPGG